MCLVNMQKSKLPQGEGIIIHAVITVMFKRSAAPTAAQRIISYGSSKGGERSVGHVAMVTQLG